MLVDLEFAELHSPLFLGGKNHQMKLKAAHDLKLVYDRDEKELLVTWKNPAGEHEAIVPVSNVSSMWPKKRDPKADLVTPEQMAAAKPIVQGKITAQVDTPQSHVFAGEGKGKR